MRNLTNFAFEIVEDESEVDEQMNEKVIDIDDRYPRVYCDFCKDYYIEEFHFGDKTEDGSDHH